MNYRLQYSTSQQGYTLIEIMVAMVILSIGILGMLALQGHSLKANINTEQTSYALMILDNLEETIIADRAGRGIAVCDNLANFQTMLHRVIPNAIIRITEGAFQNNPCDYGVSSSGAQATYQLEIHWTTVASLTADAKNGPAPFVLAREIRI